MFEISTDGIAKNLQFEFIDIIPQLGKSQVTYADLKFLTLKMSDYGVTSLAPNSLATFRKALEANNTKTLQYLTRKLGYDASSASETQLAYAVYEDIDVITTGK